MAAYAFGSNPPTHADRNRTNGNGGLLRSRSFRKLNKTAPAIGNFDQDAVLVNIFLLSHDFATDRLIEAAGADIRSKNPRACPLRLATSHFLSHRSHQGRTKSATLRGA
jgi:hypothetical protein